MEAVGGGVGGGNTCKPRSTQRVINKTLTTRLCAYVPPTSLHLSITFSPLYLTSPFTLTLLHAANKGPDAMQPLAAKYIGTAGALCHLAVQGILLPVVPNVHKYRAFNLMKSAMALLSLSPSIYIICKHPANNPSLATSYACIFVC